MTNREKFRDVFGVSIIDNQYNMSCSAMYCVGVDCKQCTFNRDFKLNSIWDVEYKEPIKVKVGDKVTIRDKGYQYRHYNELFNQSTLSKEVISHFKRGVDLLPSLTYTVLEILAHENYDDIYIAVIQNNFDDVYLIGVDGLEVLKNDI